MKDDELNKLLAPLREQTPTDFEMHKWELAMRREEKTPKRVTLSVFLWRLQLAGAVLAGFALNALVFSQRMRFAELFHRGEDVVELAHATFERSHANLD